MRGVDPSKYFETTKDGGLKTLAVCFGLSTGNNQTLISSVSGKRIRVLGLKIQSTTATQATYAIKDGNTTQLDGGACPPVAGLPHVLPLHDAGYYETSTGNSLTIDVATAAIAITVFYLAYTP